MTRLDWWLGIALVVAVVILHTAFPRYEYQEDRGAWWLKIDRWTGRATPGVIQRGNWVDGEPVRFLLFDEEWTANAR